MADTTNDALWIFLKEDNDGKFINEMPQDESVVEALLTDGSVIRAWFGCNIMDAGDWDFERLQPGKDEPPPDGDSIAELVAAWRPLSASPPPPVGVDLETFDLITHLHRQIEWSRRTFGPDTRAKGVVEHIRKELAEIEAAPGDLAEWIDVVILALDGAWRAGFTPEQIVTQIVAKQTKNEGRKWPDWRNASPDQAIEHDRSVA